MHRFDRSPLPCLPSFRLRSRPRALAYLTSWLALAACSPEPSLLDEPFALREGSGPPSTTEPSWVSLGESTTCVTLTSGDAKCWGHGDDGRLGLGQERGPSEPDPAALPSIELGGDAIMVSTNGAQSYALLHDGTVRAFGLNPDHELGLPHAETVGDDETPAGTSLTTLVPLRGVAVQVATGEGFGCALLHDGGVQCWGRGDEGQLGRGALPGSHPPGDVLLGGTAVELAVGAAHACARLSHGAVRCWGANDVGQLGLGGPVTSASVPASTGDVQLGGVAVQVVAGGAHTCARLDDGALRCWGNNLDGQLGLGHTDPIGDDETPDAAGELSLGGAATQVTAGPRHTCARLEEGKLRCWGDGTSGQLGLPSPLRIGDDETPADADAVDMGGSSVVSIFAGPLADHTCALLDDARLRCWGVNDRGQVGLGYASPQDPVEGPPGDLPDVIIVDDPDA